MRIILLGAPGSGKGTQCRRIADRYSIAHLSSGDILRSQRSAGTELGEKARRFMDAGELVPDELIVEMMSSAMKKAGEGGFVLDGFPRTVNQAEQLDKQLAVNGKNIDEGDYVIIDNSKIRPQNNDYVLSIIDGTAAIKKFHLDETNQRIILLSESNKDYPPIFIHQDDFDNYMVNGKVIQVIKKP